MACQCTDTPGAASPRPDHVSARNHKRTPLGINFVSASYRSRCSSGARAQTRLPRRARVPCWNPAVPASPGRPPAGEGSGGCQRPATATNGSSPRDAGLKTKGQRHQEAWSSAAIGGARPPRRAGVGAACRARPVRLRGDAAERHHKFQQSIRAHSRPGVGRPHHERTARDCPDVEQGSGVLDRPGQ